MRKNIVIVSFVVIIVLLVLCVHKLNKYEEYFYEDNESYLVDLCLSVINNQDIYNKTDYENITVEQMASLSANYDKAINSYLELEKRSMHFENRTSKYRKYLAVQADIQYYINQELLNGVFYVKSRVLPEKIKITDEYKQVYNTMSELNNIYYNFIINDLIDTAHYNETGQFKFTDKISFSYWNEIAIGLDIKSEEYFYENHISEDDLY